MVMEQFEKWLKAEGFDKNGKGFQEGYKRAMELAWQAALKWAKKELKINTNGFFAICKELDNEQKS